MRDPSTKDGMCIVGDPGEGPGGAAPVFFDQTEARRVEKVFFLRPGPPSLSQGLDDRATPLSEGVDPPKTGICTRGDPGEGPGGAVPPTFLPE